jgi:hypothetical protein
MIRVVAMWVLAVGSLVTLNAQYAAAQAPYPPTQPNTSGYTRPPVLSPYLNLLRGGSPSANFFYGVVPYENRGFDNPASPRVTELERRLGSSSELEEIMPTLPGTGHVAGFMTMSPYFGSTLGNYSPTPRYNLSSSRTSR